MSDASASNRARAGAIVRGAAGALRSASAVSVLPSPWAVIELVVFVGFIAALDWMLVSFDIRAIEPNPFWLPVLLLSLQYGTVSGLLAAFAAIGYMAFAGFPEQDIGENHFAYLLRIWGQPMLWIGAALLLGQFRMRQIAAKQRLRTALAEMTGQRTRISDYAAGLRQRCDALERQIAGQREPRVLALMQQLAGAGRASRAELAPAFAAAIHATLGRADATLHAVESDGLAIVAATGEAGHGTARVARGDRLWRAVVEEQRSVSVLDAASAPAIEGAGLVAVPVRARDSSRVIGMIRLEHAEPAMLQEQTAAALDVIGRLLAPALEGERTRTGEPALTLATVAGAPADASPTLRTRIMKRMRWLGGRRGEDAATATTTDSKSAVG